MQEINQHITKTNYEQRDIHFRLATVYECGVVVYDLTGLGTKARVGFGYTTHGEETRYWATVYSVDAQDERIIKLLQKLKVIVHFAPQKINLRISKYLNEDLAQRAGIKHQSKD